MAIIVLTANATLPPRHVRALLADRLPACDWSNLWLGLRSPSDDEADDLSHMAETLRFVGASNDGPVIVDTMLVDSPFAGTDVPHIAHLHISPAFGCARSARAALILCHLFTEAGEDGTLCRLDGENAWLDALQLLERLSAPDHAAAARIDRLPTMIALFASPPSIDPRRFGEVAHAIDPDGTWTVETPWPGELRVHGRGAAITVLASGQPLEQDFQFPLQRSFWFGGNADYLAQHRCHARIEAHLDTAHAAWISIRQTAKVVTALAAVLADHGMLALYNADLGLLFAPDTCRDGLEVVNRGKLPISLWTWTAPQSLTNGAISLVTMGMEAFVGHEVELWSAPLDGESAQMLFGGLLSRLLEHGPMPQDDTLIAAEGNSPPLRCILEDSRADRGRPTRALVVTVETVPAPRKDALRAFGLADPNEDSFNFEALASRAF